MNALGWALASIFTLALMGFGVGGKTLWDHEVRFWDQEVRLAEMAKMMQQISGQNAATAGLLEKLISTSTDDRFRGADWEKEHRLIEEEFQKLRDEIDAHMREESK